MKHIFLLSAMILICLVGRGQAGSKDTVLQITLDTLSVTAPPGPPVYRAEATRVWDIKNTRIALTFNRKERTADAREWIKLHPYFYSTDSLVLDAKSMQIDSVMLVTKNGNTPMTYTYRDDELKIRFNKKYGSTDTIDLYLKYTAMPYKAASGGSGAIVDDRGLYFINTDYTVPYKPAQIWTQGETESNSHWLITVDRPNTRFTTQVELTVPDSFVTLSNGSMVKQVKTIPGMHTDIWKMDMPIQAYVVMFAIGKFSVVKDKWKNKEVNYYVEPEYASNARLMFKNTPEMMDYFSQRTGVPFPWNKYSQVVVHDYVSGAMENTSAALFGEFMNKNAREIADNSSEDVVSHELFHEWFGDYVTCASWSNLTVNESFANYGEQLWRTHKYGKAAGDELAYEDFQNYVHSTSANDPQLVRFYYDNREEMFDAISYNKGGAVLRYMNNLVGDAAFDRAMNIYLTKNALQSAEAENWRLAVQEATGEDWNWFFNEWYYHAGHPVVKVVYNYNDTLQKLAVTVSQVQSDSPFLYRLPVKAALTYDNYKEILNWNITKRTETFNFDYRNGQRPVIIPDCDHVLPVELRDGKKLPEWLAQYQRSEDYTGRRLAINAAGRLLSDSISQVITDLALNDALPSLRKQALIAIKFSGDKYRKRCTAKVVEMARRDTSSAVRAEAFVVLGEWKIAAEKQMMVNALYDSSYAVAAAALEGLSKLDKDTAYLFAKRLLAAKPKANLENTIWTIIGNKGADEDVALYELYIPHFFGAKKFTITYSLSNYLKSVKSDSSFARGAELFATLVASENMKQFRSIFGGSFSQVASDQKDNLKSDKKEEVETAKKRVEIIKGLFQKVIDSETEPDILKEFRQKMRNVFDQ